MSKITQGIIKAVQFFVLSDEDIEKLSVVTVKTSKTTSIKVGEAIEITSEASLYDPKMGSTTISNCGTCEGRNDCPGHYGMIKLNYPIYDPLFLTDIVLWLNVICHKCGRPPMGYIPLKEGNPLSRYKEKLSSTFVKKYGECVFTDCLEPIRKYELNKDKIVRISIVQSSRAESRKLSSVCFPHLTREILRKISDKTLEYFGKKSLAHPSRFIRNNILVPPNPLRPMSVTSDVDSKKNSNYMVKYLQDILQENNNLPNILTEVTAENLEKIEKVNKIYYQMIKGLADTSDKQVSSISKEIGGKQGFIRKSTLGKRCKGLARHVIVCDNNIPQDSVGLSEEIVKGISIPERVCSYNYDKLLKIFINGDTAYPGCTGIRKNGERNSIVIANYKKLPNAMLELGDILERNILPGEIICEYREPCLYTSSSTSMKVIPISGNTGSFNVCSCTLYLADFDGDQMTMSRNNTPMATAENHLISNASSRFLSYDNGAPKFGQHQDSIIGSLEITRSSTVLSRENAMRVLSVSISSNASVPLLDQKEVFSGREVITEVIKSLGINLTHTAKGRFYNPQLANFIKFDDNEKLVVIENSELKSGLLDKNLLAIGERGSLFHIVALQYGPDLALKFSTLFQQVVIKYLCQTGLSVGLRDVYVDDKCINIVREIILGLISKSFATANDYFNGKIVPPLGKQLEEYYEQIQENILKISSVDAIDNIILGSMPLMDNSLFKLIYSGSRGKPDNFKAIATCLGQLMLEGKRYAEKYDGRTSIYTTRWCKDPCYRGFIVNSYSTGLNPQEFFAHSRESRNQIVTRALTTAVAGTKSRRTIKNLEGLLVDNLHRSYRNNFVIQQIYGEDGFDPSRDSLIAIKILDANKSDKDIETMIGNDEQYAKINEFRRDLIEKVIKTCTVFRIPYSHIKNLPLNLSQILAEASTKSPELDEDEAIKILDEIIDGLPRCYYNERYKGKIAKHFKYATSFITAYLYSELNVGSLKKYKIGLDYLRIIGKYVYTMMKVNMMGYGQPVGSITSQVLGSLVSQNIISAHHRSGVGGKEKSLHRINEISETKSKADMRSPYIVIGLVQDIAMNKEKVLEISKKIISVSLGSFMKDISGLIFGYYGKVKISKYVDDNNDLLEYAKVHKPPKNIINKCVRFVLDLEKMSQMQVSVQDIIDKVSYQNDVYCAYLIRNDLILYCYLNASTKVSVSNYASIDDLIRDLQNTIVKGIPDIKSAVEVERIIYFLDEKGSVAQRTEYTIEVEINNTIKKNQSKTSSLAQILKLDYVDPNKTYSNVLPEMKEVFGIDIARNEYITEYTEQVGEEVNPRHYTLMADEISSTGVLTGISRKGNEERGAGILQQMSDEKALSTLISSAADAIYDEVNGVSPNILLSQVPRIGTNYQRVMIDLDFVSKNTVKTLDKELDML